MGDALHFAFEYFDRGWSLIPLVGKRPPRNFRWKPFQTERASLRDIRRWFGPSNGGYLNIGVVTGSVSGIAVVDCDTPDDAQWWNENFPTTPLASRTGRGGAHMFYRVSPNVAIGNRAKVLGRQIDVRGEGGYVCVPPSVHSQTGVVYRWQPRSHYSLDEIPFFDRAWLGVSHHLSGDADAASERFHSAPEQSALSPCDRPVDEVLRGHPQRRTVRRLVSRLHRTKTDRSKRDYAVVCELIRLGFRETDIWSLVSNKSKFATDGWRYFVLTYRNASQDVNPASR